MNAFFYAFIFSFKFSVFCLNLALILKCILFNFLS